MNASLEPFLPVLKELEALPLTFQPARVEQNGQGRELLVLTCREAPKGEFVYVPGRQGAKLGWDTGRCPLPPRILTAFRRYYQESQAYHLERLKEEQEDCRRMLAKPDLTEEQRREIQGWLDEAEQDARAQLAQTWADYRKELLEDLNARTSPLRRVDIPPMLAERRSWNTPERIEPPFALPTEDEWEYLCSGGVHSLFPWGNTLDLRAVCNETLDKDAQNAFGLVIGNACRAELVDGSSWLLKGDDGGCALCGGEGDRAAFAYSPYFRYSLPRFPWSTGEDIEREMDKRWRRRIVRLGAM